MKRNRKKLTAAAVFICVLGLNITPVLAADSTQTDYSVSKLYAASSKPLLTLDKAIEEAVDNSDVLKLDKKKIYYQSQTDAVNEDLEDFNDVDGDLEDYKDDSRDIAMKKLRQQKEFDEDIVVQKTTKAYNSIVTSQMKIDKAAKELDIKSQELGYIKIKESLGMVTTTDMMSKELEIENLENAQKSSENALKDLEYSFEVLTGLDITDYSLQQDIEMKKFNTSKDMDDYLDDVIDRYLKYSEQMVELNQDYYDDEDNYITLSSSSSAKFKIKDLSSSDLEDYKDAIAEAKNNIADKTNIDTDFESYKKYLDSYNNYTGAVSAYTAALSARLTYLNTRLGVYENETSLKESKKAFKEQLRTLYTNLITTEDNINYLKKCIDLNKKKVSDAKLKYDLGLITKANYDALVAGSADLDLQLRNAVETYNTLKTEIEKPWIAFSN